MMENKGLISMDLISIPNHMDIDKWVYIMKELNIICWDSHNNGKEPSILKEFDKNKLIVDISTDKGKDILKNIKEQLDKK